MDRLKEKINYIEDNRICDYCDNEGIIVSLDDLFSKANVIICKDCLGRIIKMMDE